ncbi:MAG TPA: tetratricopeptide repeat protein [Azospirillum sp.]|nr:tetratricopeptide repeat protein [Azospirillum sp.]
MTGTSLRLGRSIPPADVHFEQGTLLAGQGRLLEAEAAFRRALEARTPFPEALNNLGNVLIELGRFDEALGIFRQALATGLPDARVYYNIGSTLKWTGDLEAGAAYLRRAMALGPDFTDAYNNYGNNRSDADELEAAVIAYRRALRLAPQSRLAHENLGRALYLMHGHGAVEAAARYADEWLRDHPDNPLAAHLGAALAGKATDTRASDGFVRQTFDLFAPAFEQTLAGLGYRAPDLLAAAVRAEGVERGATILDAGCGTGLCAPLLRPLARRLVGVDLSSGMLSRAYGRGLYDELCEAELGAFLAGRPEAFDVIVAADVLCYFGALDAVLAAAARALRPGGLLAFTVERMDGGGDHRVNPHGRYTHAEEYVRRTLAGAGLDLRALVPETLRHEGHQPVVGFVVTARRPAA